MANLPLTPEARAEAVKAIDAALQDHAKRGADLAFELDEIERQLVALQAQVRGGHDEAARETLVQLSDYAVDALGDDALAALEPIARIVGRTPRPEDDAPEGDVWQDGTPAQFAEPPTAAKPSTDERIAAALERIAAALEEGS